MAGEFTVITSDNGGDPFLKLAFKNDGKWTSFFLPKWGWEKLHSLLDEIDNYLKARATTPQPLDISKRYKVEVKFVSGKHEIHLYLNDEHGDKKKSMVFSRSQWQEIVSEADRIVQDFSIAMGRNTKRPHDDDCEVDHPPAKIMMYAHIVEDSQGEALTSSGFRYATTEACLADAQVSDDCNVRIETKEIEEPTPYELAKYIMCALVEKRVGFSSPDNNVMIAAKNVTRTAMREVMKSLIAKMKYTCSNRRLCDAIDIIHCIIGVEQIETVISNPSVIYQYVKSNI